MTARLATYQDVIDAPEHVRAELIDGELTLMSRGRARHARASSFLAGTLQDRFDRVGGWWIYVEVELWLGRGDPRTRVLVPDICAWRRENYTPDPDTVGHVVPPDWVCEVLSPSTSRRDRLVKLPLFAEAGVGHVWFVDPEARSVEVFELRGDRYSAVDSAVDEAEVVLAPFDGVVGLGRLWMG